MINVAIESDDVVPFVPAMLNGNNDNDFGAKTVFVITMNPNAIVFRQSYNKLQAARARVHSFIAESPHAKSGFREFDGVDEVYVLDGGLYTIAITKTRLIE